MLKPLKIIIMSEEKVVLLRININRKTVPKKTVFILSTIRYENKK